jgi:hypothetical protein
VDGVGNFYAARYNNGDLFQVSANGNLTSRSSGYSPDYTSYGLWAESDGSALYQTIQSYHRVERITLPAGTRTVLPYGLSAAEM